MSLPRSSIACVRWFAGLLALYGFTASDQVSARCLAPGQWAFGSCGTVTTTYSTTPNYGAAIGVGIGALGSLIDMAEQEQAAADQAARDNAIAAQREAARREAARRAYCYENWRQASDEISRGNWAYAQLDPATAIPHFERAIALLSRCGDKRNIAIAGSNLRQARLQYAAIRDDNRVSDALSRYAAFNPYGTATNPFSTVNTKPSEIKGDTPESRVRIHPTDVYEKAKKRCDYLDEDSAEWNACMRSQEARLIMDADPDIRAACGSDQNVASRNDCAVNNYMNRWNGTMPGQQTAAKEENCYFQKNGQPCYPGGLPQAAKPNSNKESLRDLLRKRLQERERETARTPDPDQPSAPVQPQQPQQEAMIKETPMPQTPKSWRDEAYDAAKPNFDDKLKDGKFDIGTPPPGQTWLDVFGGPNQ